MKKSLTLLTVLAAVIAAGAQQHQPRSFLAVQSVYLTNTYNPTNLNTAGSRGTNLTGFSFTNLNRLITINDTSGATNVTASKINPFQDVALWALNGAPPVSYVYTTNGGLGLNYAQSFATLSVTWTGGSGAGDAVPFVFTPIYDGVNEATETAQEWSVSLAPTASTRTTVVTNVPLHKWPGAAKLRLRRAVNTDTSANGHVIVEDITLNGFPP